MTERGKHTLKRIVCRSCQLSTASIAKDLQTSFRLLIRTTTVCRELHGMCCHGCAAASKPYITRCSAKNWMQWYKAHCHWTLENGTCLTALCQV
ncbi:unnamed protein product [Staurois parvus]|uniref:Uncharacterized protein n=1 Tax=Staurois parvus TaxID=386267 RepID=A0ABN9GL81_9NEOB|nr:unnamed protein product [Staurois parvus]